MFPSSVYIATGTIGGQVVMKVGKSSMPKQRQRAIKLTIKYLIQCADDNEAFKIESNLRNFLVAANAKQFKGVDWFVYDQLTFDALLVFAGNQAENTATRTQDRKLAVGLTRILDEQLEQKSRYIESLETLLVKERNELRSLEIDTVREVASLETELKLYREGRIKPDSSS